MKYINKENSHKAFFYIVVVVSSYLKLNKLSLAEFKYDQMRTVFVSQQCNLGNFIHYAESSTSIPQGPLFYFFECLLGTFGITQYLNLLRIEIIISQLCIFLSFFIFKKYLDEKILVLSISCYLLNPYLIVATRNTSSHFHQEIILLLFFYLLFGRNDSKNKAFMLGFLIAIMFSIYYLLFTFSIIVLFSILKNTTHLSKVSFGIFVGFLINLLLYVPYLNKNGVPKLVANNESWGVTSYWRILVDFLSGKSILSKINNAEDYAGIVQEYQYLDFLINLNFYIILFLLLLSITQLKKNKLNEVNLIGLCIFITFGIFLTLANVALYPHYFFSIYFFGYFVVFNLIKNIKILQIATAVFCLSSISIFYSFSEYIKNNNGVLRSDYGVVYEICGCCVDDPRACRGQ